MKSEYPARHGDQHRSAGSDPIWDGDPLLFNVDNEGGWLYVVANDATDIDFGTLAILLADLNGAGLNLRSQNNGDITSLLLEPTQFTLSTGTGDSAVTFDGTLEIQKNDSSMVLLFNPAGGGQVTMSADTSIELSGGAGTVLMDADGVTMSLLIGDRFAIKDHTGAVIFQWNEDGTTTLDGGGP